MKFLSVAAFSSLSLIHACRFHDPQDDTFIKAEKNIAKSWTIEPLPDAESPLWTKKIPPHNGLNPAFPRRHNEGDSLSLSADQKAKLSWGREEEEQFNRWGVMLDAVDDCATRASKQGKTYPSFNDCLAEAPPEEQQFLAAKLVYRDMLDILRQKEKDHNSTKVFRAVEDKKGHMQCAMVIDKKPSIDHYRREYPDTFSIKAVHIPAIEVAYLLTAPWNLKKDHPLKMKGAGTACMGLAALESSRGPWQGRIFLESAPSAVGYYQKLGFKAIGEKTSKMGYGLIPAMWLEPKEAATLIPKDLQ